ncbi:hypothetical protein K2F54_12280 [Cryobacterium sp. 1639]|uniref:hypothetical protein n=1 Tax=Cryobacterium inferilacus TaxID=2866629 RepID=UPI001C735F9E|nr:hypothetical protein [Cryobacterium sp. 1639]MBX0300750.1 hypothetical protein [Cryobacterium sp. 1639]
MLTLTVLQADLTGGVATVGYALGGIGVVLAATLVYFGIRLFRTKKMNRVD